MKCVAFGMKTSASEEKTQKVFSNGQIKSVLKTKNKNNNNNNNNNSGKNSNNTTDQTKMKM